MFYFFLGCLAVLVFHLVWRAASSVPKERWRRLTPWFATVVIPMLSAISPRLGSWAFLSFLLWPRHGEQAQHGPTSSHPSSGLSADEARLILGVRTSASREEIEAAYRRLMQKHHPDKGGSEYFASKINQARYTLLHQ